jgi:hypothetical protein
MRSSGLDAAGIGIGAIRGDIGGTERKLKIFAEKAKKNFIPKVFALDIVDADLVTAAVIAHYDYIAGQAVHDLVDRPDNFYRFRHGDLYKGISNSSAHFEYTLLGSVNR